MIRNKLIPAVIVILSLVAAAICAELLEKHVSGAPGPKWFEVGCGSEAEGQEADCAKVLASPYSYFPPKPAATPEPEGTPSQTNPADKDLTPRVPTAFLGLVYYSGLALWFLAIGRPSPQRRWMHLLPLFAVLVGLCFSAWFVYIMSTVLNEWCPWCVVTHAINAVIAIAVLAMFPGSPKKLVARVTPFPELPAAASSIEGEAWASAGFTIASPHPSKRLVFITILAILILCYAHLAHHGLKTWKHQLKTCLTTMRQYEQAISRIQADAAKLVRNWELSVPCDIPLRPDDPIRTGARPDEKIWTAIVFSDFECPSCRRLAAILDKEVQPLFDHRLAIHFKHSPLHSDCNSLTKFKTHKHACFAASAAEAARFIGGNDSFWKAHDYLFSQQDALKAGKISLTDVASTIGIEETRLADAMKQAEVAERIREDVSAGGACQITGTPSVYIQGRKVDALAVTQLDFWDALADRFWVEQGMSRPPSTRITVPAPKGTAAKSGQESANAAPLP